MTFYSYQKKLFGFELLITWCRWDEHPYYKVRSFVEVENFKGRHYLRLYGLEASLARDKK